MNTTTARDIVSHEITLGELHVSLSDGSRHVAKFEGCISASDAWEDIDESAYTFEAAAEEYDFTLESLIGSAAAN